MGTGPCLVKKDEELRFLVAEDERVCRSLLVNLIRDEGFTSIAVCGNGQEALSKLKAEPFDLVLTDLSMPYVGGKALIKEAKRLQPDLTIMVVSGQASIEEAVHLVKEGVFDVLSKPFNIEDFKSMIHRAIHHIAVTSKNRHQPVLASLLRALSRKDHYLEGHSERVAELAKGLAEHIDFINVQMRLLEQAAVVHDLGKIGISEDLLNKPAALDREEWEIMRRHPVYTVEILEPLEELKPCIPLVKHHHERIDGSGYPDGLVGDEIPVEARIISVVDTFDAMNSDRAYRKRLPYSKIIDVLKEARGTQLDATIVDVFLNNITQITEKQR